jgi:glucose-1-phosphate thymidylyltransferase
VKGLILAGGNGTRLYPSTRAVSKQLLPVYDKPMVYFPLSTLMLAGIREIAIISSPSQLGNFKNLLGDGSQFGIELTYIQQNEPRGLADAFIVGEDFLEGSPSALILGDNLFYGAGLGQSLSEFAMISIGAQVFASRVSDPASYGILELDSGGRAVGIVEKPSSFVGNFAIPGLYFLDDSACERAKAQSPSLRGELEIADLLSSYLEEENFTFTPLARGTVWLDMGTPDGLAEASDFVRIIQRRQKVQIACLEEVALNLNFISTSELVKSIQATPFGPYRTYLEELISSVR